MNKRALILLGGARKVPEKEKDDIVICADSGYLKALELSIEVDHLVGDMDSISKEMVQNAIDSGIAVSTYPEDKDLSDGEIALRTAIDLGCDRILLVGGKGGRIDHILSTVYLPLLTENWEHIEIWLDNDRILTMKEGNRREFFDKWNIVSLIPIGSSCVVSTEGLKWQLSSERLIMGTTRGIHNEPVTLPFSIECEEGSLLVVLTDDL